MNSLLPTQLHPKRLLALVTSGVLGGLAHLIKQLELISELCWEPGYLPPSENHLFHFITSRMMGF